MTDNGRRFPADERLRGVLSHFYVISTPAGMPAQVHHLSPSLEMMLVFNFGEPVAFSFGAAAGEHAVARIGILGPLRQLLHYELKGRADLLVLNFVYDGFYRFLSLPLDQLQAGALQEDNLYAYTQRLEDTWLLLSNLPTAEQRIAALTDHMLRTLSPTDPGARALLEGVPDIHNPALSPVKTMAGRADISERTVQLRFKKFVGYSPKELLRFLRFKAVVAHVLAQPQEKVDWVALVVQYGYHDQSHLIRDFNYYTGVSPTQFIRMNEDGHFCVSRD